MDTGADAINLEFHISSFLVVSSQYPRRGQFLAPCCSSSTLPTWTLWLPVICFTHTSMQMTRKFTAGDHRQSYMFFAVTFLTALETFVRG